MENEAPRRRWFHPTPDRLIGGSLVVTGILYFSNWLGWWHKGYAVVLCAVLVAALLGFLLFNYIAALSSRWQFQFGIRSMLVLSVVVALLCGWLSVEMKNAMRQRQARELVEKHGGWTRCERDRFAGLTGSRHDEPLEPTWLRDLIGPDFFDTPPVVCEFSGPETGDAALASLDQLAEVDWLSVSGSRGRFAPPGRTLVGDAGLEHLRRLPRLRSLFLAGSRITDTGLANIESLSELECISLGDTGITDAGLQHFQNLRKLRSLYLSDTRVTGSGFEHLQGMAKLEDLNLRNCPLVGENLRWLRQLPLHELNLDGCRDVTDSGLQYLRSMSNLYDLSLEDTAITDAGLKNLQGLSSLRWLTLRRTKVTDKGLETIQRLTGLTCLGLDECSVTDAGLKHLEGFTHLEMLYLSKTKVTDAGLAQLRGLGGLWELTLDDCFITDVTLERLGALPKLNHLRVHGTKVTEAGVRKLKQALPNCYIDH
jgi:Leucine-rich repeat (LRR) protein